MGLFSKNTPTPLPSADSERASAFNTTVMMIPRFLQLLKETGSEAKEIQAYQKSSVKVWKTIQDSIFPILEDANRFDLLREYALTEIMPKENINLFEAANSAKSRKALAKPEDVVQLIKMFTYASSNASQVSGLANIKNPYSGLTQNLAFEYSEVLLRNLIEMIPCYLNDFDGDWTADKPCSWGKPHRWDGAKGWRTTVKDNETITIVMGYAISTFYFDPLYQLANRNDAGYKAASSVQQKGTGLAARTLINWKYENH